MAEHTSTESDRRQQRAAALAAQRANDKWPGGLSALLADYTDARATLADIRKQTGIDYRAAIRLLTLHGVAVRDMHDSMVVARRLNPDWSEKISRTKLLNPYRHDPEKQKIANARHAETLRTNPERHANASAPMSNRERAFADILERQGVRYTFNQNAAPYWLDFCLTDLCIGIEVQRGSSRPVRSRDTAIRAALSLSAILYVPGEYFASGYANYIESLVWSLNRDAASLVSMIGDARYLCQVQSDVVRWYGFGFKPRWSDELP